MPKYKNQHFVSKGLVSFFKSPNGQVFYWDKKSSNQLVPRNPRSVHSRKFTYSTWDVMGKRENSAEHSLQSEIDDQAPVVVRRILESIEQDESIGLSSEDRNFLCRYVVRVITRNPDFINLFVRGPKIEAAKFFFRLARLIKRRSWHDVAYEKYGRDKVIMNEIMAYCAKMDISKYCELIAKKGFQFFVPEKTARNLVLGSYPFILNSIIEVDNPNKGAFTSGNTELFFVLHPRLLMRLSDSKDDDIPYALTDESVLKFNGLVIKYSESIVGVTSYDIDGAWFNEFQTNERKVVSITQN